METSHMAENGNNRSEMLLLPASTVRLITSSQVITSVVSVIKELIENALDAKATNIDIKLDNYGFDKIEIRDNGVGIKRSETTHMAQRHYTSKICDHDDLETLCTYGFRGEALASLCAVSSVTMTTKTADDDIGMVYTLDHHGKITATKPAPVNQGSTVSATQLFKNIPVRKQFYNSNKKKKEELKKVEDLVMAFGVIRPEVRMTLRHDKSLLVQKNKVNDCKTALMNVLGTAVMSLMEPVVYLNTEPQITISGYVPKPGSDTQQTSRPTNDRCFIFVNKRPVHLKEIEKLVKHMYNDSNGSDSSNRRYPILFLSINVPSSVVDVNLDPNKTTVLLHNKDAIHAAIISMLGKVYAGKSKPENLSGSRIDDEDHVHTSPNDSQNIATTIVRDNDKLEFQSVAGAVKISTVVENSVNADKSTLSRPFDTSDEIQETPRQVAMDDRLESVENEGELGDNIDFSLLDDSVINMLNCEMKAGDVSTAEINVTTSENILTAKSSFDVKQVHGHGSVLDSAPGCEALTNQNMASSETTNQGLKVCGANTNKPIVEPRKLNKNQGMVNLEEITGVDWSAGRGLVDGKGIPIQPVQILGAACSVDGTSKTSQSPVRNKRPLELKDGQSTLYDMVCNTPIRRPVTALQCYANEVKPQVVEESPGLSSLAINKVIADKWEILDDEEREKYETIATNDENRYHQKILSSKRKRSLCSVKPVGKRKRVDLPSNQPVLDTTLFSPSVNQSRNGSNQKPEVTVKVVDVPFDMQSLKKTCKLSGKSIKNIGKPCLIGRLKSHGIWFLIRDQQVSVFNHYRVEETLLYHRLISQHLLPRQPLEAAITLNANMLGGTVLWQTLLSMQSEVRPPDQTRYYTDKRLLSNGFEIQQTVDSQTGDVLLQIVAMASCLSYVGVHDLKEILELVATTTAHTVAKCRPVKVIHYLQLLENCLRLLENCPRFLENCPRFLENCPRLLENCPRLLEKLSQIAGTLSQIAGKLSQIAGKLSQIAGKLFQIAEKLSQIVGKQFQIVGKLSQIAGKLSQIAGKLSQIV
ncbi:PMS1 protein homolog 1-like [Saccoglossus kowalevskii]